MKNVTFDGSGINVFGVKGYPHGKKDWALDILWDENDDHNGFDYMLVVVSKPDSPASVGIEKIIANDASAGRDHLIDHVRVCASIAVQLFLEGKLRKTDFANAVETNDSVTIPNVEFAGRFFNLVVKSDWTLQSNQYMGTIDASGEVV